MLERESLPPGKQIGREVEDALNSNPNAEPEWEYASPDEQIFPEEAPTKEQRQQASYCLSHLSTFVSNAIKSERPITPQDVKEAYEAYQAEAKWRWGQNESFPDFNLTHVFGATKRMIAWFEELKAFEETDLYDKDLEIYRTTQELLEQAVKLDGGLGLTVSGSNPAPTEWRAWCLLPLGQGHNPTTKTGAKKGVLTTC